MMKKINWIQLKHDYVFDSNESVSDFLKQQGFKLNGYTSRKTFGWSDERKTFQDRLDKEIASKTIDKVSDTESEIRARQVRLAKKLQTKALEALEKFSPTSAEEARRMLVDGLKEEREATGINKNNQTVGTNIFDNPIMKTRYAEPLKKMNYDQLIRVLQRLKELDNTQKRVSIQNQILSV